MTTITLGYRPGCIGRVAQLHGAYYARTQGFGVAFEARVARELAAFCLAYTEGRDGLWLAADADANADADADAGAGAEIEASIAIDGSRAGDEGAHLRWFVSSDRLRGQGVGRQLLQRALAFADARAYPQTFLWTFDGLRAARHLYESCGFELAEEGPGSQWGRAVIEQTFVRRLPRA